MSTIYQILEPTLSTATLQAGDRVPVYNTSTGRTVSMTGAQIGAAQKGVVNLTAGGTTLSLTQALHANRVVTTNNTAPFTITLPASAGTGDSYTVQIQVVATATTSAIKVANGTDVMQGFVAALTTSSDNVIGYHTSATSDTIALNGTTLGGVVGDWVRLTDVKTGFWMVEMQTTPTGSTATPFSATVS